MSKETPLDLQILWNSLGLIISQWKETTVSSIQQIGFRCFVWEKNDGWKIQLATRQFQRKIDDLPSDLSLDVDSDRPLSDLASGIIETLLQMAGR